MRVGLVGLGLIGTQRLQSIVKLQKVISPLEVVGYVDPSRTDIPNKSHNLQSLLDEKVDLLFVAVPHHEIFSICEMALQKGVRVHVEKPLGTNLEEATLLAELDPSGESLTIGFNYRFFRGVEALVQDLKNNAFGELIRVDLVIGHGGSPADLGTWKLDPLAAGGGSLLDPGIHLLDLLLLISEEPQVLFHNSWSGFWRTGIDEESNVVLTSSNIPHITVTSSIVRWKSEFMIRAIGVDGYGIVTGRGRSYGPQRYIKGERWGWQRHSSQSASENLVLVDDCEDSFEREIKQLIQPESDVPKVASSQEGLRAMKLLAAILEMKS